MSARQLPPELAEQLRALLHSATPASVPPGILVWWGAPLPDGSPGGPSLQQPGWEFDYMRLECGALAPGIVRPLPELLALLTGRRPDGPLPLALARFRYAVPSAALLDRVHRAVAEGRPLRNPPPSIKGEIEVREAFLCCGLLHEQWGRAMPAYRGRRVPFLLTPALLLSNPGVSPPDSVEIDPGDGQGFRAIEPETPLEVDYPGGGAANVALRCHYGTEILQASFTLSLSDEPPAPPPDEQWPLKAPCGNTGTAHVYRARGAAEVRHPLVIVEGFPGGHPADYLYETLNQQATAEALRDAGYDVVIVGLDQGADAIERNAEVLIECIRAANQRTDEPLVVGGVSMGGLVSRLALLRMEHDGERHNACVFLTIDTPHAGSYTSLGAQWFVHAFAPHLPGLAAEAWLLDSPANQQFVLWWLHGGTVQTSPLREAFIKELSELGDYPQLPRRLAISCGRGDGAASERAGIRTLDWSAEPWLAVALHALTGTGQQTLGEGHWFLAAQQALVPLHFKDGVAWDVAPGGQDFYNAQVAAIASGTGCGTVKHALDESCQVPTVSALDLNTGPFSAVPAPGSGASPFQDYACAEANYQHLTITPKLSAWLLSTLGPPCVAQKDADHV
ncbi:MAG: cytochrome [Solirubrobacterales bacterium]|nr:cytochrome [Solirubrobacterales bacterium]